MFQFAERRSETGLASGVRAIGFTLVEVLIVVTIIVILISILVPTLSGTRTAARSASTRSIMTDIGTAVQLFKAEKDRQPGPYTPDQMGHPDNLTRGVTQMENAIVDLMGGRVPTGSPDPDGVLIKLTVIGNDPTQVVMVNPNLIGAPDGPGYLSIGRNVLSPVQGQYHGGNPQGRVDQMPDILDPFGSPVVLWTRNMVAGRNPEFSMVQAPTNRGLAIRRGWYYWAGNAGYLRSSSLGVNRVNQSRLSVLGRPVVDGLDLGYPIPSDTDLQISLGALLGHPNLSRPRAGDDFGGLQEPTAPLSDVVLHSAGPDGVYLGNEALRLRERAHLRAVYQREGQIPERSLPIDRFDDLIVPAG